MKRGTLLAFEGIDGAGKSTQLRRLAEILRACGRDVVATREPTEGPYGTRIREMAQSGRAVAPEQELDWFMADRREHVDSVIEPALSRGAVVMTDRYFLSTAAYQGARGLGAEAILRDAEARFPVPDLALLFELSVDVALGRVRARGGPAEPVFEEARFLERVRSEFAAIERPYVIRIEADAVEERVAERCERAVRRGLPELFGVSDVD